MASSLALVYKEQIEAGRVLLRHPHSAHNPRRRFHVGCHGEVVVDTAEGIVRGSGRMAIAAKQVDLEYWHVL